MSEKVRQWRGEQEGHDRRPGEGEKDYGRTRVRILSRWSTSGRGSGNRLGIRRRNAGSMSVIRFVAPRINILSVSESRPSHSL